MQDTVWANDGDQKICTVTDLPWKENPVTGRRSSDFETEQANARLIAAAPEMLEALEHAAKLIKTARQYFPKNMHNGDKFDLENTCACIGNVIAKAKGQL